MTLITFAFICTLVAIFGGAGVYHTFKANKSFDKFESTFKGKLPKAEIHYHESIKFNSRSFMAFTLAGLAVTGLILYLYCTGAIVLK